MLIALIFFVFAYFDIFSFKIAFTNGIELNLFYIPIILVIPLVFFMILEYLLDLIKNKN